MYAAISKLTSNYMNLQVTFYMGVGLKMGLFQKLKNSLFRSPPACLSRSFALSVQKLMLS